MQRIDGQAIAAELLAQLHQTVARLPQPPRLAVVLVGDDPASVRYIAKKRQAAEKIGIAVDVHACAADTSEEEVAELLKRLQTRATLDGLIVQLPLPTGLATERILNLVDPLIDVDCLTNENQSLLATPQPRFIPPTPAAILEILTRLNIDLARQKIVIVGRGRLVGQPLAAMLRARGYTVVICNSTTEELGGVTAEADILITAVGQAGLITGQMIGDGAVVIDAGCELVDGKLSGDVNPASAEQHAAWFTPTPGGVGPLTVVKLLENVVLAARRKA